VSRRRAWLWAGATLLVAATAAAAVQRRDRLRHVALPVWDDPSLPASAPVLPVAAALPATTLSERARLPSRITAIVAAADGTLFVATFDGGLFRCAPGAPPRPAGDLSGRERFIDALVAWDGGVVAATHAGAIALAPDGARRATWLAGEPLAALAVAGDQLYLGGPHGLWAGTPPRPLPLADDQGAPIRVTALAASAGRLYLGSPDGVYSTTLPAGERARWHPLVFGSPAANSNVVTALVTVPTGVLAGTDDAGPVLLDPAGAVHALPLGERAANRVNPGALTATAGGTAVLLGSDGGGLVRLGFDERGAVRASRPAAWPLPQISAITSDSHGRLLIGTADGILFTL
jgi:hypothetical protein